MQINLSDADALILREMLEDYLPALQRESARTEAKELRHALVLREELIDRLLFALKGASQPVAT
jgi:hypothetical protein